MQDGEGTSEFGNMLSDRNGELRRDGSSDKEVIKMKEPKTIIERMFDNLKTLHKITLTDKEASEEDYQALFHLQDAAYDLRKLMDRKCGREERTSTEISLKDLPFDCQVIIAIAIHKDWPHDYHETVLLSADEKASVLFEIEWRETSFDDTLAELGDELPKNTGLYRLSCTANLETEYGEFGTILSQYPYLTINSAIPVWLPEDQNVKEN